MASLLRLSSRRLCSNQASLLMRAVRTTRVNTSLSISPSRAFSTSLYQRQQPKSVRGYPFMSGSNVIYMEEMYEQWKQDPESVSPSLATYFAFEEQELSPSYERPPSIGAPLPSASAINDHVAVNQLVRAYQTLGHRLADLDPLKLDVRREGDIPELTLAYYGLSEADLDREFLVHATPLLGQSSGQFAGMVKISLRNLVEKLKAVYCQKIGYEYMFIPNRDQCNWLRERIEAQDWKLSAEEKKTILKDMLDAAVFEEFLAKKYGAEKRFGLEGCESLITGMRTLLRVAQASGTEDAVVAMAHRGRLNVLHNILEKPMEVIFKEFKTIVTEDGSGDVKYHVGMNNIIDINNDQKMYVSLMANPSHLEAVNPVALGRVRAMQGDKLDDKGTKVMGVLVHGDGAFSGQGIGFETFGFSGLKNYKTGGTVHIVTNNQIAFTTDPKQSRSSDYCTDLAKVVNAPIIHVNADSPEHVVRCFRTAAEWRNTHGRDVVIDLVCYRKNGHNEGDNAAFTQPEMYKKIQKHKPACDVYSDQLVREKVISENEAQEYRDTLLEKHKNSFDSFDSFEVDRSEYLPIVWDNWKRELPQSTGLDVEYLREIGLKANSYPEDLNVHKGLQGIIKRRVEALKQGDGLDWSMGELLAFASLLREKYHIRLSGQDVERGTFSHRHHVLHDQTDDRTYIPLTHLSPDQAKYVVSNSHLSEFAVLGYELGYSMQSPNQLVMWEAQFGDFANTAACIIDNFLSSGEAKWGPQNGLVMMLPHGYEGMGPEHSSCRIERFLQMSDDNEAVFSQALRTDPTGEAQIKEHNWQVANCTTPANYFHLLRRQVLRHFRKPLVIATPKALLREKRAASSLADMAPGTSFQRLIPEVSSELYQPGEEKQEVKRVIFCSGKVYYDLLNEREQKNLNDVVFARVEQISPFPFDKVQEFADHYPRAEIVWCQEEPKNMGCWSYVRPRIETALKESKHHGDQRPKYVGRPPSASTAAGSKTSHKLEVEKLLEDAFNY